MKVVLIRHGVTQENLERRFLGITDVPLAPQGAEEALAASARLPRVEHIYVSPLIRCRQTAALIWPSVGYTLIPELRETDFGPFEGKSHEELKEDPLYNQWLNCPDDPSIIPPPEDMVSCGLRASRALRTIAADSEACGYGVIGVVSHGGTLMSMLARHGRPPRDYYSWRMETCGGYLAELEQDPLALQVLEVL